MPISALDEKQRRHAHETAVRLLKDDGVTYLAEKNGQQTDRPWQLDMRPDRSIRCNEFVKGIGLRLIHGA